MAFSSEPTDPDRDPPPDFTPEQSPVAGTRTRHNWLALASFLLSFSPVVVWGVVFAFGSVFYPPIPMAVGFYHVYQSYYDVYTRTTLVAGVVSFVGSLSALVTSTMALDWAKRFPGRPEWEDLARWGKGLGLTGLVAIFVIAPCAFFGVAASNYGGG